MKIGTVIEPVPVTELAANFSPIPRTAPPPLGSSRFGAATVNVASPRGGADELTPDPMPDGALGNADDLTVDPIDVVTCIGCVQTLGRTVALSAMS